MDSLRWQFWGYPGEEGKESELGSHVLCTSGNRYGMEAMWKVPKWPRNQMHIVRFLSVSVPQFLLLLLLLKTKGYQRLLLIIVVASGSEGSDRPTRVIVEPRQGRF